MKICVLDGHTTVSHDLSWEKLHNLGDAEIFDLTPPGLLLERARGSEILLTNKTVITADDLDSLPNCRLICVMATGYDTVDVAAAACRGIPVCTVPAYATRSVAQTAIALLLELCQQAGHHSRAVKGGRWSRQPYTSFMDFSLTELDGKTMGLIGFGRIGRAVGQIAEGFGMRVLAHDQYQPAETGFRSLEWCSMEEIFSRSDVVSLHCPLLPETAGMVNRDTLAQMRPNAFLINTSRGRLVNEDDLVDALRDRRIAGAGLDVLSEEPPPADHPLFAFDNCIITPHIGWATRDSRQRLIDTTLANIRGFLDGRLINVVNGVT